MVKKRSKHSKSESSCQKRRPWTAKEDAAIRGLVEESGVKQWTVIADNLQKRFNIYGRSGKQCRERWHNHLNTGIVKQPWSVSEECKLFSTHQKIGNKWAEISKEIPGRTDNSIKNHFYSTVRKFYRKIYGKEGSPEDLRINIRQVTDAVLESLDSEKNYEEKPETVNEDEFQDDIFPDFSDMVITGHGIRVPQDWIFTDFPYEDDQEVLVFPLSPYENSQVF
jgi:hypothetical protein